MRRPRVVGLGLGRPPLSIHPPLQAADGPLVGGQCLTEERKTRLACSRDQRDRRWSQVRSDDVVAHGVLLLAHTTAVYSFCLSKASSIPPPLCLERNGGSSPGLDESQGLSRSGFCNG